MYTPTYVGGFTQHPSPGSSDHTKRQLTWLSVGQAAAGGGDSQGFAEGVGCCSCGSGGSESEALLGFKCLCCCILRRCAVLLVFSEGGWVVRACRPSFPKRVERDTLSVRSPLTLTPLTLTLDLSLSLSLSSSLSLSLSLSLARSLAHSY